MAKKTRAQLKKEFFSGKITALQFMTGVQGTFKYRGFYDKPGVSRGWSGPDRLTRAAADRDNLPYYLNGYNVDVYIH